MSCQRLGNGFMTTTDKNNLDFQKKWMPDLSWPEHSG